MSKIISCLFDYQKRLKSEWVVELITYTRYLLIVLLIPTFNYFLIFVLFFKLFFWFSDLIQIYFDTNMCVLNNHVWEVNYSLGALKVIIQSDVMLLFCLIMHLCSSMWVKFIWDKIFIRKINGGDEIHIDVWN